jgi:hypothetical protein
MGEIDRKEVVAVGLLAVGILLFANPAYTQGQGGSAAEVVLGQEIEPSSLGPATVTQINQNATQVPVVEYERLNNESRAIFDTGRQGIYLIRNESEAQNAVLQSGILYGDDIYLRQTQETQRGVELRYVDRSGEIETNIMTTVFMSEAQRNAFRNATEQGSFNLSLVNRGIAAYDYVYDNETGVYYETEVDRSGNATVLSVTETEARTLVDPYFTGTDEMSAGARQAVVSAIDGERPVVTGEVLSSLQGNTLVEHDGGYYQLQLGEASTPITEAFGPLNFAGMGIGLVLMGAGVYVARRVFVEKT